MTRIAHLSDLHFGAEDPKVVEALISELNSDLPDLVVISGDLTQGGHHSEFRAARRFIDRLRVPTLAVPGNHDITPYNLIERFSNPYARWRQEIGMATEPNWGDGQVAVLGLNTARRFGLHWDWSRGRVTHARLQGLVRRLEAVPPGISRIVVAHHPLLPPESEPGTPVAGGARRALEAFSRHNVSMVLAGHLHRGYARLAAVGGGPPLVVQGSTATSVRLRGEPNAYHRIIVDHSGVPVIDFRVWNGKDWTSRASGVADPRSLPGVPSGNVVAVTIGY
jgi:3',5'-cyclic AMP phosphodiesterase CpdA